MKSSIKSSSEKIQQHFYTRERLGLFRKSEGYDSVAASPGLDENFVKEKIHPYCVYSPPEERILTLVNHANGWLFFGNAAFKPMDFTGRRSTFFCHNFIIPPSKAGGILADFNRLIKTQFETEYDFNKGQAQSFKLNELDALPAFANVCVDYSFAICKAMQDEIINSIHKSIEKNKNTYVVLPDDSKNRFDYTCFLLLEIYKLLPGYIKHQLGFCTFASEPVNKKGIHLVFTVENVFKAFASRLDGSYAVHLGQPPKTYPSHMPLPGKPPKAADFPAKLSQLISTLSSSHFFEETEFWRLRMPELTQVINQAEASWIDKNLEKLTLPQILSIPQSSIKQGLNGGFFRIYVMLSVIKTVLSRRKSLGSQSSLNEADLHYLLGNYFLSLDERNRITAFVLRYQLNS